MGTQSTLSIQLSEAESVQLAHSRVEIVGILISRSAVIYITHAAAYSEYTYHTSFEQK